VVRDGCSKNSERARPKGRWKKRLYLEVTSQVRKKKENREFQLAGGGDGGTHVKTTARPKKGGGGPGKGKEGSARKKGEFSTSGTGPT